MDYIKKPDTSTEPDQPVQATPLPLAERRQFVAPTKTADQKVQAIRDWASI